MMATKSILLLELIGIVLLQNIKLSDSVLINTKSGPINGYIVKYENKIINKFLSIPYAEPPVGHNRFGPTKPVNQWKDTYNATYFRNVCLQKSSKHPMNENCLYLNIYSEAKNIEKPIPVMFWIHGGGLSMGDGYDQDNFDGTVLASKGVVVVSINYRLGPFGFLYGNDTTAPGSVGILDQIMALHWVKDNIALFGGDPDQITIFGFSAGSRSVSILTVSPLARGLFKRGIMQSGAYHNRPVISDKNTHLNESKNMAKYFGCDLNKEWLDCLRNISATDIYKYNKLQTALSYGDLSGVMPIGIDEALKQGKVNEGIELIVGTTNNEGFEWAIDGYHDLKNLSIHITKQDLKVKLDQQYENKFSQALYEFYISNISETNQTQLRRAYSTIITDIQILCPAYYFAKNYAKYSSNLYFYANTYVNQNSGCNQEWMGVCHGSDTDFIFGKPITHKIKYSETDYDFSLMLTELWTGFSKTGNPLTVSVNNTQGIEVYVWPQFLDKNPNNSVTKIMELNPNLFGKILVDPYHERCDEIVKHFFD